MALATLTDLEQFGVTDFTNNSDPAVLLYLSAATALVEEYCGQPLEQQDGRVEVKDVLQPSHLLQLDCTVIRAITTVTEDGVTLVEGTDFHAGPGASLARLAGSRRNGRLWMPGYGIVTVTYDVGYIQADATWDVPDSLRWVCANIAARLYKSEDAWANTPAGAAGPVSQVSLDGVGSYSQGAAPAISRPWDPTGQATQQSAGSAPTLTPAERTALSPYVRRKL